jgi:hypothetical protein
MFAIIRMIGWVFLFVGFLLMVRDIVGGMSMDHGFHPKTMGDVWNYLSPGTPDDVEGRYVFKYGKTWTLPLVYFIHTWAFAFLLAVGLILDFSGREHVRNLNKRGTGGKAGTAVKPNK